MAGNGELRKKILRGLGTALCWVSGFIAFSEVITFIVMLLTGFDEILILALAVLFILAVCAAVFYLGRMLVKRGEPEAVSGPGAISEPREVVGPEVVSEPEEVAERMVLAPIPAGEDERIKKVRSVRQDSADDVMTSHRLAEQHDELVGKIKAKTAGGAGQPAQAVASEQREGWERLMTGQLVARYKQTHDEALRDEYLRRLKVVGLTEAEAMSLFTFELMIIKHDAIARLADDGYLTSRVFDLQSVALDQDKDWYIDHQWFLVSEIVKIWDEAEWHYFNSRTANLPDAVWDEIHGISRYGGGELFVEYLTMVSEKAHVPLAKVNAYGVAEQQLLFAYKWNPGKGERNPYQ